MLVMIVSVSQNRKITQSQIALLEQGLSFPEEEEFFLVALFFNFLKDCVGN